MSRVMVVDDMAICREPIAASLRLDGYDAVCAANGREALTAIESQPPDLIVLDIAMPVMDGLSFLQTLRSRPGTARIPVILLSAVSERRLVMQALRLGVQGYMLKSAFSLQELRDRVAQHVKVNAAALSGNASPDEPAAKSISPPAPPTSAPGQIPQLLTRELCIQRAEHALQAKTLSGVVAQVIAMAASPRGEMSDLAALISKDAILSARVLQAANSPAYRTGRGAVTTILDAVRNIGWSTVKNIAAALGIFDVMPKAAPDGFNPIRCWQHSFATGVLCEKLAASTEHPTGVAYLAGLCHDLGEILFRSHFGPEYQQVLEMQKQTGKPRQELERAMLGMTQGELVRTIFRCINLPETIRKPIEAYHDSRGLDSGLTAILRLADAYANGSLLASTSQVLVAPLMRSDCRAATRQDNPPTPNGDELRGQILSLTGMLGRLSADDTQLMTPLFARRAKRVVLVREAALSEFDPIAAALGALADVEVLDTLPGEKGQLVERDALVIVTRSGNSAGFGGAEIARAAASSVASLPTLWLTGTPDAAPGLINPVLFPLPLEQLAAFVAKL